MAAELEGFVRGLWNERDLKKKEDMTPFEPFDAHFSRGSGWRKPEDRSFPKTGLREKDDMILCLFLEIGMCSGC